MRRVARLMHEGGRVHGLEGGHRRDHGLGHGHQGLSYGLGRVYVDPVLGHYCVEAVVVVSCVVNRAHTAVSLHERVLTTHSVTVPVLPLALDVPRVQVVHAVVEQVVRVSLQQTNLFETRNSE